ncbi:hypothetical protein DSO57_1016022 [Entomophthora muscae]|uniref:Uncharacterized protein n=1 Tax=Entomophthora muscae TaxID=34485 RepID=A0ACC2TGA0_9FUNG|nr:hypothetical protein DSO57_1016022 [Entomophthora muscae]
MARVLGINASKTFQHLMREVDLQTITVSEHDKEIPTHHHRLYRDCEDILAYFESNRKHKELLSLYAPRVEEGNRVEASANRVGLQLPKVFSGDE